MSAISDNTQIPESVVPAQLTAEEKQLSDITPITEVVIHRGDSTTTMEPDYLHNIYPDRLNQYTLAKGIVFRFHFLSKSLNFWVQMAENKPPNENKLSKKNAMFIREQLRQADDAIYNLWEASLEDNKEWLKRKDQQAQFVPPGESRRFVETGGKKFEITFAKGDDPQLVEFREKFQFFLFMYVDGASVVKAADPTWGYYIVYNVDENGRHFAGLMSRYEFKLTVKRVRQRISQALVLPCYQKLGLGKEMLDEFYSDCLKQQECFEITVQGPSFQFQCLRDFKEAESIVKEGIFKDQQITSHSLKTIQDIHHLRSLYLSKDRVRSLKTKLKLPGHQIQRLTNIFMYASILDAPDEFIRAIFQDQLRRKTIVSQSAFRNRKVRPSLFIEGQALNIDDYLLVKTKEDLIIKTHGEIEQILEENLSGYRRVIEKLKKSQLLPGA